MVKFGIKNAFRRKTTLIIAIIGTSLGVGLMTTLLSLSDGMNKQLEDTTNKVAGDITITAADSPMGGLAGSFFGGGTPLPMSYEDIIASVAHVQDSIPVVSVNIPNEFFETPGPLGSSLTGMRKDQSDAAESIIEGRAYEKKNEIIIGKELVRRHKFATGKDVKPGDVITVPIMEAIGLPMTQQQSADAMPQGMTPEQIAKLQKEKKEPETVDLTIVGIYESGSPMIDMFFYSDPETAREIAKLKDDVASSFVAHVDNTDYVESASKEIETKLDGKQVPVSVSIAKDTLGDLNKVLDIFSTFLLAIAVVASVAGGMSIFIIMLMNVNERMKEFGILKAAGWSNWNIISSVIVEAVTVSLMGSIVGFLLGFAVTRIIDHMLNQELAIITNVLIIGVLAFGVIMGLIGGLYPAINAARVSPMKTIRGD